MIDIVNPEGNESQFTGQMAVDEMNLKLELLPTATTPSTTAASSTSTSFTPMQVEPGVPGTVQTDLYPFKVKADISFADEGIMTAEWDVFPGRISGKVSGKGIGKRMTPMRPAPY